jgi:hypothetical protein
MAEKSSPFYGENYPAYGREAKPPFICHQVKNPALPGGAFWQAFVKP